MPKLSSKHSKGVPRHNREARGGGISFASFNTHPC